ncbi:MAG: hypothetical protein F6K40_07395 [Okeania sp. SIO3I5]|uniref:hypothetical protein n=1 Tax=Okeania sp. SIO3I5 TaxID=2607805 RepID=UPI0013B912EB|nr:hypothetical protein [Okeania sp. SIO3I5]NEQ36117.1 hypothetical protein [Okeania sp. SIO3I5]
MSNDLSESESQYHVRKNNCCAVVVYFIRKGLGCTQESCNFCSTETNQPDYKKQKFLALLLQSVGKLANFLDFSAYVFFLIVFLLKESNLENHIIRLSRNKFWSPKTLEHFATNVKIETEQNPSNLCLYFARVK